MLYDESCLRMSEIIKQYILEPSSRIHDVFKKEEMLANCLPRSPLAQINLIIEERSTIAEEEDPS